MDVELHEPSTWGVAYDSAGVTVYRRVDWLRCQACGFKSITVQGLHLHISQGHGVSAWAYYHFYPHALQARIRDRVERLNIGARVGECWNYQGRPTSDKGYRTMQVAGAPTFSVHRLSVFAFTGTLPSPSVLVLHVCDNAQCCRPKHLKTGTHAQNMAARASRNRTATGVQVGCAALTEDQVHEARERAGWEWSAVEIADHCGVSPRVIQNLLAGATYADVPVRSVEIPW